MRTVGRLAVARRSVQSRSMTELGSTRRAQSSVREIFDRAKRVVGSGWTHTRAKERLIASK